MKIRITPGAILLWLVMATEHDLLFAATTLAATVHEAGHLLAAKVTGIPIRAMEIDLMGAKLYPAKAIPSYFAEALLSGAGPLFSLLLALPAIAIGGTFGALLLNATLSFALFNLLPIKGFDGGRLLSALLALRYRQSTVETVLFATTYLSLLMLFSLSACMLLRFGEDATLAVLSASLFAHLFLSLEPPYKKRGFERI